LTADADIFLFTLDPSKKLMVLHSFKNAGGTLLHSNKQLMCLSGAGANAIAFEVNPITLKADCPLVTPTMQMYDSN
jgi:hypothetical protein